jgi:hypothetical protein
LDSHGWQSHCSGTQGKEVTTIHGHSPDINQG